MLSELHNKWPILQSKHNLVINNKAVRDLTITDDLSLKEMLQRLDINAGIQLYIHTKAKGFSWYANNPQIALEVIHCSPFQVHEIDFPLDSEISDEIYAEAISTLSNDLLDRIRVLDLAQASEYTMRELISPVLVRALCLVDSHRTQKTGKKTGLDRVRLICDKQVSGSSGHGPIDYVMSYLNVLIVLGEAKHGDLYGGLHQNLVQQYNALEFLADIIVGSGVVGSKRSAAFLDTMVQLRGLGTYGITSTGKEWIFSRLLPSKTDPSKTVVFRSPIFSLLISASYSDLEIPVMKSQLGTLLRTIVSMIFSQKKSVDDFDFFKTDYIQSCLRTTQVAFGEDASDYGSDDDEEE